MSADYSKMTAGQAARMIHDNYSGEWSATGEISNGMSGHKRITTLVLNAQRQAAVEEYKSSADFATRHYGIYDQITGMAQQIKVLQDALKNFTEGDWEETDYQGSTWTRCINLIDPWELAEDALNSVPVQIDKQAQEIKRLRDKLEIIQSFVQPRATLAYYGAFSKVKKSVLIDEFWYLREVTREGLNPTTEEQVAHERWCAYMVSHGDKSVPCNCKKELGVKAND